MTDTARVREMLGDYRREQRDFEKQIVELQWYMRGSISRTEAWSLSFSERRDIMAFAEGRMKVVEKTKLPLI